MQRIGWGWVLFALASCSSFETAPPPPDCLTNRDCTNARICAQGSCVAACRLDTDCADGEQCVFSRCQLPPAPPLDAGTPGDMQSVDMAPASDMAPGDMNPVTDMAPTADMAAPADMAPVVDMAPADMAPAADMAPVDMAPVADMAPADMTPAVDMAPAADMAP